MTHDNINQETYNRIGTTAIIIRHKEAGRYITPPRMLQ